MAEVNPQIVAYVRRQIASRDLEQQRKDRAAEVQKVVRQVEHEILTTRHFNQNLPQRSEAMEDKLPTTDVFRQSLPRSGSNAIDLNGFFNSIIYGGRSNAPKKRR